MLQHQLTYLHTKHIMHSSVILFPFLSIPLSSYSKKTSIFETYFIRCTITYTCLRNFKLGNSNLCVCACDGLGIRKLRSIRTAGIASGIPYNICILQYIPKFRFGKFSTKFVFMKKKNHSTKQLLDVRKTQFKFFISIIRFD